MTQATPDNNTAPLPRLGHYQLLEIIGRGGMGLVYRARDTRLERDVAVKCLRTELFEAHYIERFKREALLLAKLNHPNIVQIYDLIETADQMALIMELVDGQNLQTYLREHIVPIKQRLQWLTQISEGLAIAHDTGIIHRDLKAENILINKRGQAKITDLGIAKSQDFKGTLTDHVAGSYCSMSPEQAVGDPISFKSDLFSLGILAYQLLCGAHPFGDTSNKLQTMQRIISHPPTAPQQHNPDLPAEFIDLLGQLLSKDPDKRPDNTHWVAAQFEKLKDLGWREESLTDDTQALAIPLTAVNKPVRTQDHPTFETRFVAANKMQPHSRGQAIKNYLRENKISAGVGLFSVLIIAAVAIWQLPLKQLPSEQTAADETTETSTPSEPYSQAREFNKGLEALKLFDRPGSLEAAEKSFNTILSHAPNNAAAVAGLSLVYSYRYSGDSEDPIWMQKADASAQQALKLNPQLALVHVALGRLFTIKSEHEKAFTAFAQALTLEPKNIFAWRGKVSVLRSAQRYDEAIEFAQQGLKQFPKERFLLDELGNVYIDSNNYAQAEEIFRLSIQLHPDAVTSYAGLFISLERQNRADEAMEVLQQGLQIRSSAALYGNLGNALFIRGDYLGAASAFEAAVSPHKGNPGNYLAWANLADVLLWIPGREAEAQKAYRKAHDLLAPILSRSPNDVTMTSRMALYLARLNERQKAELMLERVIALSPKNAYVHFRAGLAYELLGNRDAAVAALKKAIELGFPTKLIEAEPDLLDLRRTSDIFH
ncbi:serine/threonine protein kinase [Cellvibrio sp. KY-GH-1]|uniref:serine/threonine-protein kinase n=1 Tax=Cellvibrio sp. KY-GH-1 TaxID=2303332 RepID=UPI001245A1D4|nr:serine/threonine-protein kinase [Cellvibrio sp. KY-GH-1]QEY17122.1 serine/threonine protein kinase [Cellvibrio sp. KY-GH-1]